MRIKIIKINNQIKLITKNKIKIIIIIMNQTTKY